MESCNASNPRIGAPLSSQDPDRTASCDASKFHKAGAGACAGVPAPAGSPASAGAVQPDKASSQMALSA